MPAIPALSQFADLALLLMRPLAGLVFATSGWSHTRDPVTRGTSIGLSPTLTRFLGLAELAGGLGKAEEVAGDPAGAHPHQLDRGRPDPAHGHPSRHDLGPRAAAL